LRISDAVGQLPKAGQDHVRVDVMNDPRQAAVNALHLGSQILAQLVAHLGQILLRLSNLFNASAAAQSTRCKRLRTPRCD
jgi:hypothetical protein